jgi:hypothetical protein
MSQRER